MSGRPILPRWQCHKRVTAAQIQRVEMLTDGGAVLHFPAGQHGRVSSAYMERCRPEEGGYWVRYDDDYESYSPKEAFEDGYTLID